MQRLPISDSVRGLLMRLDDCWLLADHALVGGRVAAQGELILRYGISILGKPQFTIVPDLVVADRGEMLIGEAAWQFIIERGHLFPRADVCGRFEDGADEMLFLKQLDLALPFAVYVYADAADVKPLARIDGLVARDASAFPERLLAHLPNYSRLADWRADD
ncbi:MAG: hypothetical protein OXE46_12870 [Chloroflexi bacterium]|nr:hypothetical protein [Chloroflexota bacterium]